MDVTTRNFTIGWAMYVACASPFLVWGRVLIHLENRDQKRKQSR
jgi:hypothetical protein